LQQERCNREPQRHGGGCGGCKLTKKSVRIRREQACEVRKTEDVFRDEFAT
jgi:hypothetical protein